MSIQEQAVKVKFAGPKLAAQPEERRNKALQAVSEALLSHREEILSANEQDCREAEKDGITAPVLKRLKFDEKKLQDVIAGIQDVIGLPDPLHQRQMARSLDEGLTLYRESCPIGVIGVIFEARPDALVQISALCLKSGNCVILKGGSEASRTNKMLFTVIYEAVLAAGMPEGCMLQLEARSEINELLSCHGYVDLLIPRGSNAFVQYIMEHTKIPVMGHADGICHIYADKDLDVKKAVPVIVDSKIQYAAACNAVETLLVHEEAAERLMPALYEELQRQGVELRADAALQKLLHCGLAEEADFQTEYLDHILSVKTVSGVEEAVEHINRYGSHHTDCILTEDKETVAYFMEMVDSASVYCNCSTRFADGYRYGLGAEVGISTGKLHARGPVGMEGLVTYKYKLYGEGQIVEDYAKGRSQFHFRELEKGQNEGSI